jgi:hypothetical protein
VTEYTPIELFWKYIFTALKAFLLLALATGSNAPAQEAQSTTRTSAAVSQTTLTRGLATEAKNALPQNANPALTSLPEADTLVYFYPRHIITDAAPRVLPEKELAEMRTGFSELKKDLGVDPTNIDYIVLQVRFKKPNADLNFSLPEFMAVISGDFDGMALLKVAQEAAKEKLRTETYGGKTIYLISIDEVAKQAEATPMLKALSELAFVLLDGNTVAAGSTAYVKAAVDAREGKNRISPDLLNSALRDPSALVSVAGSPWTAFAKTFALLGTENNPRAPKCDSRLGDFYAAITMDATSFKFRGAMNADNPDTAKIIKSLLASLLQGASGALKDSKAQSILNSIVITPTETEVLVQADFSQQAVADFIREQSAPTKQEVTTEPNTAPKRTPRKRHRRTRRP